MHVGCALKRERDTEVTEDVEATGRTLLYIERDGGGRGC